MPEVLYREAPGLELRASGDGRTVHGLAVPYGETVDIYEMGRSFKERFLFGAFKRSIAQRGNRVKLLVNHEARARLPIGKATSLRETSAGLEAEFRVSATRDGDEALELIRDGVVDGFSVGFAPITDRNADDGVIERVEASLREVSLTAFPAYAGALVAGLRSVQTSEVRERLMHTLERFQL